MANTPASTTDDVEHALTSPVVPAPWTLTGRGIILALRPAPDERWRGEGARGPALVILADYSASTAGPYGELLYIPGAVRGADGRRHLTIPHIVVTTEPAMTGGRVNWGTPKTIVTTRFAWAGRSATAEVDDGDGPICRVQLSAVPLPPLPVTTAVLPSALLRFEQELDGQRFRFTPSASGWMKLARVTELEVAERFAPGITRDRLLGAVIAPRFTLRFPVASSISSLDDDTAPAG